MDSLLRNIDRNTALAFVQRVSHVTYAEIYVSSTGIHIFPCIPFQRPGRAPSVSHKSFLARGNVSNTRVARAYSAPDPLPPTLRPFAPSPPPPSPRCLSFDLFFRPSFLSSFLFSPPFFFLLFLPFFFLFFFSARRLLVALHFTILILRFFPSPRKPAPQPGTTADVLIPGETFFFFFFFPFPHVLSSGGAIASSSCRETRGSKGLTDNANNGRE